MTLQVESSRKSLQVSREVTFLPLVQERVLLHFAIQVCLQVWEECNNPSIDVEITVGLLKLVDGRPEVENV
jgi:hypothetical protein